MSAPQEARKAGSVYDGIKVRRFCHGTEFWR